MFRLKDAQRLRNGCAQAGKGIEGAFENAAVCARTLWFCGRDDVHLLTLQSRECPRRVLCSAVRDAVSSSIAQLWHARCQRRL